MNVFLEDKLTKLYFAKDNHWVEIEKAMCFPSSLEAEEFARKENINDVVILIKTPNGNEVRLHCNSSNPFTPLLTGFQNRT